MQAEGDTNKDLGNTFFYICQAVELTRNYSFAETINAEYLSRLSVITIFY